MAENVTLNSGQPWKPTSIEKLRQLWSSGVPAPVIAQTLGRSEGEIASKASELKLPRH
jgi:hypothetical protein